MHSEYNSSYYLSYQAHSKDKPKCPKIIQILGTNVDAIDRSEDRERFKSLANKLVLKQPPNRTVKNVNEALLAAEEIGFPIVVRPSYV